MKTYRTVAPLLAASLALCTTAGAQQEVRFTSPGMPPTVMTADGRLQEDWGALAFRLLGEGLPAPGPAAVTSVRLDDRIPAARAVSVQGTLRMTRTAYRAPIWPAGIDVLTVRVENTGSAEAAAKLAIDLPDGAHTGRTAVTMGGRTVLLLPSPVTSNATPRDWGYDDEAVPMRDWARPEVECDPAFRHIRAGMGGVPIAYRFAVAPGSAANVVLGLCEGHWTQAGQRPLVCHVEGAPAQTVDPIARWGHNRPGALLFTGRDVDGDGRLAIRVVTTASAPDQNPILNAIWLFPVGDPPALERVISGQLNGTATRYVDVGGENDRALYPPAPLEYALTLPAGGAQEWTFLVACRDGSVPMPSRSGWSEETLRRAAREVWRDWRE